MLNVFVMTVTIHIAIHMHGYVATGHKAALKQLLETR